MAIKTIRVFAEYTSDGYVPMPSQGNIDYGITIGNSFPETQPSSYQTDDPNIDVAVNTMTDFYVWIRTHGSPWNPSYTRVVRVYPDSPSINSVVMNMIVAVGSGGTSINAGGGVTYYLNGGTSQGVLDGSTYYEMSKTPVEGAMVDFFKINTTGFENIAQFVTDAGDPSLLKIPPGAWPLGFYFSASDNSGSPKFYAEIYKYSNTGVFTLLGSSVASAEVISNGVAIDYYTTTVTIPETTLLITDRIAIRIFVDTDGNRTVNFHTQDAHLATVGTTFANGLTAINGLTKQVQFIAIGTAGSDAAIVSSDDTHTINLPTASATKRGLLNSTDWSTFNAKQAALSGTGFVKIDGSTISYDNSTYQPLDGDLTAIGALAGTTGILKKTGANTWELDTTTYLSTGVAASTYQRLDKMVSNLLASDTEYPNSNAVLAKLALKANAENPEFTGYMTVGGAYPKIYLTDSDNNPDYFIGNDDGYFRIYDQTNTASRFYITNVGVSTFPGSVIVGSIAKSGGLSTEFLKADGTVDANTYVTSSSLSNYLLSATAASTYQRLDKMVSNLLASDTEYPNSNAVLAALALKADAASPTFTGNMTISSANPKLYLTDTDNNPDYFIGNDDGYFRIYDQTAGASRFYITSLGVSTFPGDVIVGSIAKSGGTASQFLKADGSVDTSTYALSSALSSYLLSTDAATTYQRKDKMVSNLLASDTEYPNSNAVIAALALKANAANPTFTGDFTISGATPRLYFVDTDNNPDYTLFTDSGYFYIYDQTAGATKFQITPSGNAINTGTLTSASFIKSGGTSSQFLMADGSVSTGVANQITGSLNTGYVPKATGANTLGNSLIYDNGSQIQIGTTSTNLIEFFPTANSPRLSIEGGASSNTQGVGANIRLYDSVNGRIWGVQMDVNYNYSFFAYNGSVYSKPIYFTQTGDATFGGTITGTNLVATNFIDSYSRIRLYFNSTGTIAAQLYENGASTNGGSLELYGKASGTVDTVISAAPTQLNYINNAANFMIGYNTDILYKLGVNGAGYFNGSITSASNVIIPSGFEYVWGGGSVSILGNTSTNSLELRTNNSTKLTIASTGAATFTNTLSIGDDFTLASTNPQIKWNAGNLRFTSLTAGNVMMTITQAGNVMINTTTDAGYKLDVNGTGRFSNKLNVNTSISGDIAAEIINTNTTGYGLLVRGGLTTRYALNVVNATDTVALFTVLGSGAATFSSSVQTGNNITVNSSTYNWYSSSSAAFRVVDFGQYGSVYSYQDGAYYSGFTNNAYFANSTFDWRYKNTGGASNFHFQSGNLYFETAASGTAGAAISLSTKFYISQAGSVQIGPFTGTPAAPGKLFISRSDQYGMTLDAGNGYGRVTTTDDFLYLRAGGTDRLTISSSFGYVATSDNFGVRRSPTVALDVNGTTNGINLETNVTAVNAVTPYFTILESGVSRTMTGYTYDVTTPLAMIITQTAETTLGLWRASDNATGSTLRGMKSRGTAAAPISPNSGDVLFSVEGWAIHGAGPNYPKFGGGMRFVKDDTFGTANTTAPARTEFVNAFNTTSSQITMTILPNGNVTALGSMTATAFFESSDSRLKELLDSDAQVKDIENLKAKLYIKNGKKEYGYFAQEAESYMPSAVTRNSDGYLNLSYREVHTVKIARLEQRVAELEKQLNVA